MPLEDLDTATAGTLVGIDTLWGSDVLEPSGVGARVPDRAAAMRTSLPWTCALRSTACPGDDPEVVAAARACVDLDAEHALQAFLPSSSPRAAASMACRVPRTTA